jgi:hypothetical protein
VKTCGEKNHCGVLAADENPPKNMVDNEGGFIVYYYSPLRTAGA